MNGVIEDNKTYLISRNDRIIFYAKIWMNCAIKKRVSNNTLIQNN